MIQESFKHLEKKDDTNPARNVNFTKTVPLKIVQLHQNEIKDQNPSCDQSSVDYND